VRESRGKPHGEVRENPWMLLLKFLIGTPLLWLGTHLSLLWFGTHLSAMRRTHTPTQPCVAWRAMMGVRAYTLNQILNP
jgi:hypothetical protein